MNVHPSYRLGYIRSSFNLHHLQRHKAFTSDAPFVDGFITLDSNNSNDALQVQFEYTQNEYKEKILLKGPIKKYPILEYLGNYDITPTQVMVFSLHNGENLEIHTKLFFQFSKNLLPDFIGGVDNQILINSQNNGKIYLKIFYE